MNPDSDGLQVRFCESIDEIPAAQWNRLCGTDYPFLRHEFLAALEHSGAVGSSSGWQPCHAVVTATAGAEPVGCMPLYHKTHSQGEFVFDQPWAAAWEQAGHRYYPKLLTAVPFTPETGPRLGVEAGPRDKEIGELLCRAVQQRCYREQLSSWHLLFADADTDRLLGDGELMQRRDLHYVWHNRNYTEFADFTAGFSSRKRKNLRRERHRVSEQGFRFHVLEAEAIGEADWALFLDCYRLTHMLRSGHLGYLPPAFFAEISRRMPQQLVMIVAELDDKAVACALCFRSSDCLYGRYWGSLQAADCLHFETCYYQGIEYCIRNGLSRFEPGVQGPHKLQRGFEPVPTSSWHWFSAPEMQRAVADFLRRERSVVALYREQASTMLPFSRAHSKPANSDR